VRAAFAFLAMAVACSTPLPAQGTADLYDLSLEQLSTLRISSGASLTKTDAGKTPASMTVITRQMIETSGARSLDELLEIYVPNYLRIRQSTAGPVFGFRGIINDQNQTALVLVNGRITNKRSSLGAMSERFLPALGDIESIEVIRGPGSAVFGPGAISGVISIRTLSASSFTGLDVTVKQGAVEQYSLGELRFGRSLGNKTDVFAYLALDKYQGADASDSPVIFSRTRKPYFVAGVPVDSGFVGDNQAVLDRPHYKAHLQLQRGDTKVWGRYVRGSTHFLPPRAVIENRKGFEGSDSGVLYEQTTLQA